MKNFLLKINLLFVVCFLLAVSCKPVAIDDPDENIPEVELQDFGVFPAVVLTMGDESIDYSISASIPPASSYDVYWMKGPLESSSSTAAIAEIKTGGTKIAGASLNGTIDELTDGELYLFLVTAKLIGFNDADSDIEYGMPGEDDSGVPGDLKNFLFAPLITITGAKESFTYKITASTPQADSYDIFWTSGNVNLASLKSGGTKITAAGYTGTITGLLDASIHSVAVTAKKAEYNDSDSGVTIGRPKWRSLKRGVGYNFNFPRPNNSNSGNGHNNASIIARDMDLLGQGITWWYNWAVHPGNSSSTTNIEPLAKEKKLPFVPMIWSSGGTTASHNNALDTLRDYANANPDVKYVLAYNEPNFTQEANMTPAVAATFWPALTARASELKLKVVSPAMNFGTMAGYGDPALWLEEFFGVGRHAGQGFPNVYLNDIEAVAVHLYNDFGNNVRTYIDRFRQFGKPVWMTEWCAWDDKNKVYFTTPEFQINFMSQSVIYMELDPAVQRYAWYIPKGGTFNSENTFPWNKLLTAVNASALPNLTPLGVVYVNMSTLDKSVFYLPGETIPAKDFSNSNISELVPSAAAPYVANTKTWQDGVRFRPTTDTASEAFVLDIVFFTPSNNSSNMWVEYQVTVPDSKQYTLIMHYTSPEVAMNYAVTVNGGAEVTVTVLRSSAWATHTAHINLTAGDNIIRLRKATTTSNSTSALNWLMIE